MRLLFHCTTQQYSILLENYEPTMMNAVNAHEWVRQAMAEPEVIGGLYWLGMDNKRHELEMKQQGLYAFLLVFQQMMSGQQVHIYFDFDAASDDFICKTGNIPVWLLRVLRFFGMYNPKLTYKEYLKAIDEIKQPRPPVSKPVSEQPDSSRFTMP